MAHTTAHGGQRHTLGSTHHPLWKYPRRGKHQAHVPVPSVGTISMGDDHSISNSTIIPIFMPIKLSRVIVLHSFLFIWWTLFISSFGCLSFQCYVHGITVSLSDTLALNNSLHPCQMHNSVSVVWQDNRCTALLVAWMQFCLWRLISTCTWCNSWLSLADVIWYATISTCTFITWI